MVIVSKHLVPKGYIGMALFPFVFIKYGYLKQDAIFLNHEKIHLRQQLELLILPFFIWYGVEFWIRYIQYRNWRMAYKKISFEQEAYAHEHDMDYLRKRVFWGFMGFL